MTDNPASVFSNLRKLQHRPARLNAPHNASMSQTATVRAAKRA